MCERSVAQSQCVRKLLGVAGLDKAQFVVVGDRDTSGCFVGVQKRVEIAVRAMEIGLSVALQFAIYRGFSVEAVERSIVVGQQVVMQYGVAIQVFGVLKALAIVADGGEEVDKAQSCLRCEWFRGLLCGELIVAEGGVAQVRRILIADSKVRLRRSRSEAERVNTRLAKTEVGLRSGNQMVVHREQ